MNQDSTPPSRWNLRSFVPDSLLRERETFLRLGRKAGPIYARLRLLDGAGVRSPNMRRVSPAARSFLFVCFGNLMRSPMAEALFRKAISDAGLRGIHGASAGLHAIAGNEAHPWALMASQEIGLPLTNHRAQPVSANLVTQADAIFAMDFQNKAELLAGFPEFESKILMLSAYANGPFRYREIPDPYFGDIDATRRCYGVLQACIGNLTEELLMFSKQRASANSTAVQSKRNRGWDTRWSSSIASCSSAMRQDPKEFLRMAQRAVVQVGRVVTGRQIAGRNLTVFPDDVFLTSYPRSGNTWLRFLIGNLAFQDEPVTFANIEWRIPEINFHSDHRMRMLPSPRLLKSHECFQPHYPRVIYIVRDPRDVAVSFYHHNIKAGNIPDRYPMEEFTARFIAAQFDPKWGSWSDHVVSWLTLRRDRPGFVLLRYEDMKSDPARELARVAAFLEECGFRNIDSSPEKLQRAIELSSPERMRELEKKQGRDWVLTKHTRADKPFIRTATAGGWRTNLSPSSVAMIESAWGPVMRELGYEVGSGKRE